MFRDLYLLNRFLNAFDSDFYRIVGDVSTKRPYKMVEQEDRLIIIHNALGISEEDIKVKVAPDGGMDVLTISGETTNEAFDSNFAINSRFYLKNDAFDSVEYSVKNGLLIIELMKAEIKRKAIPVTAKKLLT